jgi:hypothetical protein
MLDKPISTRPRRGRKWIGTNGSHARRKYCIHKVRPARMANASPRTHPAPSSSHTHKGHARQRNNHDQRPFVASDALFCNDPRNVVGTFALTRLLCPPNSNACVALNRLYCRRARAALSASSCTPWYEVFCVHGHREIDADLSFFPGSGCDGALCRSVFPCLVWIRCDGGAVDLVCALARYRLCSCRGIR